MSSDSPAQVIPGQMASGGGEGFGCGALSQGPGYQPKQDTRQSPTGMWQLWPPCPPGNRGPRAQAEGAGREELKGREERRNGQKLAFGLSPCSLPGCWGHLDGTGCICHKSRPSVGAQQHTQTGTWYPSAEGPADFLLAQWHSTPKRTTQH